MRGPPIRVARPSAGATAALLPVIVAALVLALAGCHGAAPIRPIEVDVNSPEKDVLHIDIELEHSIAPIQYLEWAEEQLAAVGHEPVNPRFPEIPVYEVWYRFRLRGDTLAEVAFRRDSGGTGRLEHARTVVRPTPASER